MRRFRSGPVPEAIAVRHDDSSRSRDDVLAGLIRLHDAIDREISVLVAIHRERLECRLGCSQCCVDGITVFDVEAERIRRFSPEVLETVEPHLPGACAFLDPDGACRIYSDRPYVCRTQGLPLRWIGTSASGEMVEMRDICPLNEDGPPIEDLSEDRCWTLGPVEGRLAELQRRWGSGREDRVALRDLLSHR